MNWRNLLSPAKVVRALQIEGQAGWMVARHGRPDRILHFLGGFGDELLLTCVARELTERHPGIAIWQISHAADLLRGNPDYALVLDGRYWALRHSNLLERWRIRLSYAEEKMPGRAEKPPAEHILAALCRSAGLTGTVRLRPWYHQAEAEAAAGRLAKRQISIQSVGDRTHENWLRNKTWFHERFQEVVQRLANLERDVTVIQVGSSGDAPLSGVLDLRGKTSLRETAAILSQSETFIGTAGLLSHLARAAECRSVIIYGGREHAWQTGYSCNENLEGHPLCAPCWLWNDCDFDRICMRQITADHVVWAVERVLARHGEPLAEDRATIEPGVPATPASPGFSVDSRPAHDQEPVSPQDVAGL